MTKRPWIGWRGPGSIVLLAIVAVGFAAGSKPAPSPSISSGPYGVAIGADSLANTQVGGASNLVTSYRFRATQSSALKGIMIYIVANGDTGYSNGNGGSMSITVQTDDGSSTHAPSGAILATASYQPGNPGADFPTITFSSPPSLAAGHLYHIVFTNTDPSPTVNFVSLDSLFTFGAALTPQQPRYADADWGQLISATGSRNWSRRTNYTPVLDLAYTNGVHAGMGYMEVWVNESKSISGSSAVRETFTPTANHAVSSISVRVSKASGSSPLGVNLETSGGSVMATGSISAAAIGSSPNWADARLSSAVTLTGGQAYLLVLTTPSDTSYSAFSIERGDNYNFPASDYYTDGYAQYTLDGTTWLGFDQPGGRTNATDSDLQFYFGK